MARTIALRCLDALAPRFVCASCRGGIRIYGGGTEPGLLSLRWCKPVLSWITALFLILQLAAYRVSMSQVTPITLEKVAISYQKVGTA